MIQFVSKERYINSIANGEKAFLIYVDNDSTVWLQADMEIGGNSESTYTFALADFLNLQGNAKYLLCEDTDLSPISKAKTDQYYYIYVL